MDIQYWILFLVAVYGVSFIPGPSTLIAFAHGANFGWSRSIYTASGNCTASILQAIAASAGLGLVLTSSATLFMAIKYAGAAYLVYVGVQMWRTAAKRVSLNARAEPDENQSRRLFVSGFMVAASNPKAIAFFTALFPQFLSPNGNSAAQLATMIFFVGVAAFTVALTYGFLGSWIRGLDLSKKIMTRIYKTTGGLFIASGAGLAIGRN